MSSRADPMALARRASASASDPPDRRALVREGVATGARERVRGGKLPLVRGGTSRPWLVDRGGMAGGLLREGVDEGPLRTRERAGDAGGSVADVARWVRGFRPGLALGALGGAVVLRLAAGAGAVAVALGATWSISSRIMRALEGVACLDACDRSRPSCMGSNPAR